jgi:hypothetical protein
MAATRLQESPMLYTPTGIYHSAPGNSAASHFSQKGPTCWYYASKMILVFHDMPYENVKLQFAIEKYYDLMGYKPDDPDEKWMDAIKLSDEYNSAKKASKIKKDIIGAEKTVTQLVKKASEKGVNLNKDKLLKTHKDNILGGKLGMTEIYMNYLGMLPMLPPQSIGALKEILETYGPLYAGGHFASTYERLQEIHSKNGVTYKSKTSSLGILMDAYVKIRNSEMEDLETQKSGGVSHAIVIWGCSLSKKEVYFSDPNYAVKYECLSMPWTEFAERATGACIYFKKCPYPIKGQAVSCAHNAKKHINLDAADVFSA